MKKSKLNAKGLRMILLVTIFAIIGLSASGFYFAQKWLLEQATSISLTVAESNSSGTDLQAVHQLQTELAARQAVAAKANSLVASSQTYQSQAIKDINTYAKAAGIQIANFSFTQATAAGTTTTSSKANSNTSSITATLTSPTSYQSLLKFMSYIEGNIPKMQVSSLNLGRVDGGGSDSVRIDQITIDIYTQ